MIFFSYSIQDGYHQPSFLLSVSKKFESLSEVWLFWSPSHWNACAHFKFEHCVGLQWHKRLRFSGGARFAHFILSPSWGYEIQIHLDMLKTATDNERQRRILLVARSSSKICLQWRPLRDCKSTKLEMTSGWWTTSNTQFLMIEFQYMVTMC